MIPENIQHKFLDAKSGVRILEPGQSNAKMILWKYARPIKKLGTTTKCVLLMGTIMMPFLFLSYGKLPLSMRTTHGLLLNSLKGVLWMTLKTTGLQT